MPLLQASPSRERKTDLGLSAQYSFAVEGSSLFAVQGNFLMDLSGLPS
jgi:hypothetical protein